MTVPRQSTAERVDDARLLWAASPDQRIGGAWWPRSRNITVELAGLLPAADAALGAPLIRVSLNPHAWDHQPGRLYCGARVIRLAWFNSIDLATVAVSATPMDRITLCLVPPEWTATAGESLFHILRDTEVWPGEPSQLLQCGAELVATG
jgi:hypothetical protein